MLLLEYIPMLLRTLGCYSDESAMKQVVPETLQHNTELYEKVVEVSE